MLARRGANLEAVVSRDLPDGWGGQALPKGARALHAAVMSGEPGAVQALLEAGARLERVSTVSSQSHSQSECPQTACVSSRMTTCFGFRILC